LDWPTFGRSLLHGSGFRGCPNARIAEANGLLAGLPLTGAANDSWAPMPRGEVAQVLWNVIQMLPQKPRRQHNDLVPAPQLSVCGAGEGLIV